MNSNPDAHRLLLLIVMIGPATGGIRPFQIEHIVGKNLPVLVGRIQIKQEHAVLFHEKSCFFDGLLKILPRANVIIGIKGGDRCTNGAIQIQMQNILPQQKQPFRNLQLVSFFPQDG